MAAEEVVLLFLTARPALHATAEQRAAFDLPGRSLRRALCTEALVSCGLAGPQPQTLTLRHCRSGASVLGACTAWQCGWGALC